MNEDELQYAWTKFDRGDALTDQEIRFMIPGAEAALRYLRARGERFVASKTCLDLQALQSYLAARGCE